MGLSLVEFTSLSEPDKKTIISKSEQTFVQNRADFTIQTMSELPQLIDNINILISEGKRPGSR